MLKGSLGSPLSPRSNWALMTTSMRSAALVMVVGNMNDSSVKPSPAVPLEKSSESSAGTMSS